MQTWAQQNKGWRCVLANEDLSYGLTKLCDKQRRKIIASNLKEIIEGNWTNDQSWIINARNQAQTRIKSQFSKNERNGAIVVAQRSGWKRPLKTVREANASLTQNVRSWTN